MLLWVDDDILASLSPFIEELKENGYRVILATNPDEMWGILKNPPEEITGIILDIMMPTGEQIDLEKAEMGFHTGLIVLNEIKERNTLSDIPVIIFTIIEKQEVFNAAKKYNIKLLRKQETLAHDLVKEIQAMGIKPDEERG